MTIQRGELWWCDLGEPRGAEPGFRRPVLIVQDNVFNNSQLATVIVLSLTTNLRLADLPGNVLLRKSRKLLQKTSTINVSQLRTIDKDFLDERIGQLPKTTFEEVEEGLRLVLGLSTQV